MMLRNLTLGLAPAAALMLAGNPAALAQASGSDVAVRITGLEHMRGAVIACLWTQSDGFPTCQKSASARKQTVRITGAAMTVTFRNVPAGSYAVSVQHDEDGDGKLKTNFIGMPREGVGMSNNPGGIPRWSRCQFAVAGDTAINVTMRYL